MVTRTVMAGQLVGVEAKLDLSSIFELDLIAELQLRAQARAQQMGE